MVRFAVLGLTSFAVFGICLSSGSVTFLTSAQATSVVGGTCYTAMNPGQCDELPKPKCSDKHCECKYQLVHDDGTKDDWTSFDKGNCNTYFLDNLVSAPNGDIKSYGFDSQCIFGTEEMVAQELEYYKCGEDGENGMYNSFTENGTTYYCYKKRTCEKEGCNEDANGFSFCASKTSTPEAGPLGSPGVIQFDECKNEGPTVCPPDPGM